MAVEETKSGLAWFKFRNCVTSFRSPNFDHARLTSFNCRLIRSYIWEFLHHPDSRKAVEAAECFARGQMDKRALAQAKRKARRVYDRLPDISKPKEIMERQAAYIAWLVAFHPSAPVTSVADMIVNSHANLAHLGVLKRNWAKVNQRVEAKLWTELAAMLLEELGRTDIDNSELASLKDEAALAAFYHPYWNPNIFREWVLLNVPTGSAKEQALAGIDAFFHCARKKESSNEDLRSLIAGAQHEERWLREIAAPLILLLAIKHRQARDAFLRLFECKDSKARITAISFFHVRRLSIPSSFVRNVISKGLVDKSTKVRQLASAAALTYTRRDFVSALRDVLSREHNPAARMSIEMDLDLLDKGYHLHNEPSLHPSLSVWTSGGVANVQIPQGDLSEKTLARLAKRIRQGDSEI